jgi:hypothetical protein
MVEMGNLNAENYMRIRLAKVQVNMLYETICNGEKNRRLNLGPRKFTTHVLNYIEAAIRNRVRLLVLHERYSHYILNLFGLIPALATFHHQKGTSDT